MCVCCVYWVRIVRPLDVLSFADANFWYFYFYFYFYYFIFVAAQFNVM